MTGKGLERQGRDEFHGASGHDHWHFESRFNQQSNELDGFITGDSASDTEDHDQLFVGAAHEIKITDLLRACKLLPIGIFRSLVERKFTANCHEYDFCQFSSLQCCALLSSSQENSRICQMSRRTHTISWHGFGLEYRILHPSMQIQSLGLTIIYS